jgi:hypothetical protein
MFLASLELDTELNSVVQACYDLNPFELKTVTDHLSIKAVQQKNQQNHQSAVMLTTTQNAHQQPQQAKSNKKKKAKQADTPHPKAVAPTLNQNASLGLQHQKTSNEASKFSDPVDQFFKHLENSISELTELVKKLVSTNMLGIVHSNEGAENLLTGPFDYNFNRSTCFIGTIQSALRDYFSRFLVFDTGATQSCVMNLKLLQDVKPLTNHFLNTFLSAIEATHVGTLKTRDFFVSPVYYVPSGCANLYPPLKLSTMG